MGASAPLPHLPCLHRIACPERAATFGRDNLGRRFGCAFAPFSAPLRPFLDPFPLLVYKVFFRPSDLDARWRAPHRSWDALALTSDRPPTYPFADKTNSLSAPHAPPSPVALPFTHDNPTCAHSTPAQHRAVTGAVFTMCVCAWRASALSSPYARKICHAVTDRPSKSAFWSVRPSGVH